MKSLNELAIELANAKQQENVFKEKRIEAEEAIAAQVETSDNGSATVDAGSGMKLTVKRALSYKANVDSIREIAGQLPDDAAPLKLVPASWAFDEKAYERLREDDPETYEKVAFFVEAKPRKVSVTLKL